MMYRVILILTAQFFSFILVAQKTDKSYPLKEKQWDYQSGVEFLKEEGAPVMKILPVAGPVVAKGLDFMDGTISFSVKPNMITFHFHYQDEKENEGVYLRMNRAGDSTAVQGIQYAPYIDGVLLWDLYPEFQSNAMFTRGEWNQVKFVISGPQMMVYVNDFNRPALVVDHLAGNPKSGSIAFSGDMTISNLVITPNEMENLASAGGFDPTQNDPRYIRRWAVSEPVDFPEGVTVTSEWLPSPETRWNVMSTERRALLNITRIFGNNEARSLIWLKLNIESSKEQMKTLDLGFLDDVWVYLNGQIMYLDQNINGRLVEKEPGGRCSIENTSLSVPLKQGQNELMIALGNDPFWGRGAVARFRDLEGITVQPDPTFDPRFVLLADEEIEQYAGDYEALDVPVDPAIKVSRKGKSLYMELARIDLVLYPKSETRFFSREFGLEAEFMKTGDEITGLELYSNGRKVVEAEKVK